MDNSPSDICKELFLNNSNFARSPALLNPALISLFNIHFGQKHSKFVKDDKFDILCKSESTVVEEKDILGSIEKRVCPVAEDSYTQADALDLRMTKDKEIESKTNKNSERYFCNICGKSYASSSNLTRHRQTHRSIESDAARSCPSCAKKYVSSAALAMHIQTHQLKYPCHLCKKSFSRAWLLRGHLRSHSGERPYHCSQCTKKFADRSNLRAHLHTHSPEKLFKCSKCEKNFALKAYLNKHLDTCYRTSKSK